LCRKDKEEWNFAAESPRKFYYFGILTYYLRYDKLNSIQLLLFLVLRALRAFFESEVLFMARQPERGAHGEADMRGDIALRAALHSFIVRAAALLEVLLAGLVLVGLLFSAVPLIKWMPGLLRYGNDVEIRSFLERSLDIVIGIEFIKMLIKHSPGSSLEVLMYAIARHMVVGHESAMENLLSVCSIAVIFLVRKFWFVPSFGAHLPGGKPAPDLCGQGEADKRGENDAQDKGIAQDERGGFWLNIGNILRVEPLPDDEADDEDEEDTDDNDGDNDGERGE